MIDVNLLGLLYTTHYALPLLRDGGGGDVINWPRWPGESPASDPARQMTKWGVVGFSESLRQEGALIKVRVTCIEPGWVDTELQGHNTNPMVLEQMEKMFQQLEKVLEPADIANAVVYAASQPEHVSINEFLVRPSGQSRSANRRPHLRGIAGDQWHRWRSGGRRNQCRSFMSRVGRARCSG